MLCHHWLTTAAAAQSPGELHTETLTMRAMLTRPATTIVLIHARHAIRAGTIPSTTTTTSP